MGDNRHHGSQGSRLGKDRAGTRPGTRASQPRGHVRHDTRAARRALILEKDLKEEKAMRLEEEV